MAISSERSIAGVPDELGPPSMPGGPVPTAGSGPWGIALGPDGAMWFTLWKGNAIGRISMDGAVTEYRVPTAEAGPYLIAAGPDGAMWFTEFQGQKIGRITMKGDITEFATPSSAAVPAGIAVGTDGAMWFAEQGTSRISKVGPERAGS